MKIHPILLAAVTAIATPATAASLAQDAGRATGEFGAGVGESISGAMLDMQPQWITINPRSKEECLAESGGELNKTYMRCRNGRQEYVHFDARGNKRVLGERPIPVS